MKGKKDITDACSDLDTLESGHKESETEDTNNDEQETADKTLKPAKENEITVGEVSATVDLTGTVTTIIKEAKDKGTLEGHPSALGNEADEGRSSSDNDDMLMNKISLINKSFGQVKERFKAELTNASMDLSTANQALQAKDTELDQIKKELEVSRKNGQQEQRCRDDAILLMHQLVIVREVY